VLRKCVSTRDAESGENPTNWGDQEGKECGVSQGQTTSGAWKLLHFPHLWMISICWGACLDALPSPNNHHKMEGFTTIETLCFCLCVHYLLVALSPKALGLYFLELSADWQLVSLFTTIKVIVSECWLCNFDFILSMPFGWFGVPSKLIHHMQVFRSSIIT
jgi:hypothetical protein